MPAKRGGKGKTKLARLRLARGLSQAQLAREVGLTRTTYWRLEAGHVPNPRLRMLVNCAIALDVELDAVIEDQWREWYPFDRAHAAQPPQRS